MNELLEIIDEILDTNFLDQVWKRLRFQVFIGIGVTVGTSFLLMIFLAFYIYGKFLIIEDYLTLKNLKIKKRTGRFSGHDMIEF